MYHVSVVFIACVTDPLYIANIWPTCNVLATQCVMVLLMKVTCVNCLENLKSTVQTTTSVYIYLVLADIEKSLQTFEGQENYLLYTTVLIPGNVGVIIAVNITGSMLYI